MRLAAATGAYLDLRVVGYEFPDAGSDGDGRDEWDANWLLVRGTARASHGDWWSFEGPAVTTWELAKTALWMRRAAKRCVGATCDIRDTPPGGDPLDVQDRLAAAGWLIFTEPNLSFAVAGYHGQQVEILVGLGHESAPPPVDPRRGGRCELVLPVQREMCGRQPHHWSETWPRFRPGDPSPCGDGSRPPANAFATVFEASDFIDQRAPWSTCRRWRASRCLPVPAQSGSGHAQPAGPTLGDLRPGPGRGRAAGHHRL